MTKLTALLALTVLSAVPVAAFRFYPIVQDFEPTGPGATQNFYVENTTENRIAVQIEIVTRRMDPSGAETHESAADEFLVYPSQIILDRGVRQTVRVQWLGGTSPEMELAYRIVAEQLPVNFEDSEEGGGQIDIMFRYMGALYIVPEGVAPEVIVESATVVGDGRILRLVLANRGTSHTILRDLEVLVSDGGRQMIIDGEGVAGVEGENVLAETRRVFELALPRRLPEGPVRAEIRFTETR